MCHALGEGRQYHRLTLDRIIALLACWPHGKMFNKAALGVKCERGGVGTDDRLVYAAADQLPQGPAGGAKCVPCDLIPA